VPTSERPSRCPLLGACGGQESRDHGRRDRDESDEQRHLGSGIVAPGVATGRAGDSGRAELTDDVVSGAALARDRGGGDRRRGEGGLAGKGLRQDHQSDHGKQALPLRHGTGGVGDPAVHHDARIVQAPLRLVCECRPPMTTRPGREWRGFSRLRTPVRVPRRGCSHERRVRPEPSVEGALRTRLLPRTCLVRALPSLPIDHLMALASLRGD
jgi:hypothetical protein